MQTQKIAVMGASRGEFTVVDVPATIVDIGSEYITFVHRDPRYYENHPAAHRHDLWKVSEQSTGTIVTEGRTRKMAIANATAKVREVGRDNMRFAVERQRAYLKENNVVLV